jgi:antitoxin YefM
VRFRTFRTAATPSRRPARSPPPDLESPGCTNFPKLDRLLRHEPVIITRSGEDSVVMLSLADYKSLEETAYLLRSPKNAKRLIEAIAELERGGGTERELTQ